MRLFLTFLLLSFILTNCPTENDPNLVDMTASVNPGEAGTVNPPNGTYTIGREITVEAIATDDRWQFTGWSGDTTATGDSLSFVITRDMELIANYEIPSDELSKAFSNRIILSDGTNTMDLYFGMDAEATTGFDSGIDRDLPPSPPEGSFYGQFNIPDYNLAEDYRAIRDQKTVWELEFGPDRGQSITLSWDFSDTDHIGALTLTDNPENPSFEVDMKSETSHEASDESVQILYIISENEN